VFVDGCFWHGCPHHGRDAFTGPNADLWTEKMARNRQRDAKATALAVSAGFRVVRIWECAMLAAPADQAALLRQMRDISATRTTTSWVSNQARQA
jgi:DNA mismatch endonuclease (patch repair protein)